jgi:hypothetical protein
MSFTMNEQDKHDDVLLRELINPGRIEKAPQGFASRTLARIRIETEYLLYRCQLLLYLLLLLLRYRQMIPDILAHF